MVLLRLVLHILGDVLDTHVLAHIVIIDVRLHLDQIDDTAEGILAANGELDRHGVAVQTIFHHLHNMVEVGAHDVHLIDVRHARDAILFCLTPHGLGLRLNAALGTEDRHRAVEHTQGALNLNREVHVTGSVDDVDTMSLPEAGRSSRSNGNTSLLLLRHPVHRCSTVMRLADLMIHARIIKNTLGGRSLTGIDVRHDADVAGHLK